MREVENLAMTTIATHKTDLQNLLQKADSIIESIKITQEKTDQRDDQSIKLREYYLKSQEEDMQSMLFEMLFKKVTYGKLSRRYLFCTILLQYET